MRCSVTHTHILLLISTLSLLHSATGTPSQAGEIHREFSSRHPSDSQLHDSKTDGSASDAPFPPAPECRQRHRHDGTRAALPISALVNREQAVQLAREGKLDEALATFEAVLKANSDDLEAFEDYIVVLNWAGRDADAIARFSQLRWELTPDYVLVAVARSHLNLGQYDEAMELFEFGRRRSPGYLAFATGQIVTLAEAGQAAAAIELSSQLLNQNPDDPDVLLAHARALRADRAFAAAIEVYDHILTAHPERRDIANQRYLLWLEQLPPPGAEHLRAVELARQGDVSRALSILSRLQQAAPDDLRLIWDLILVSSWAGRHITAVELFRSLNRDFAPDYVVEAAAKSIRSLRRFDEAAELYRYSRSRWPDSPSFAAGFIRTTLESGQINEAAELGCRAELDHPNDVEVLLAYAAALQAQGRHAEEREIYDRVLELAPERPDVRQLQHAASRRDGKEHLTSTP